MKITHRYITENEFERIQRQAAIHRKCLLMLQAIPAQTPAAKESG